MVKALKIEYAPPKSTEEDPIMGILDSAVPGPVAIPMVKGFKETAKQIWQRPASSNPSTRRVENLYKIREEEAPYLYRHPLPNSMVSEVIPSKQTGGSRSSPLDKEGRKLDILGRKIYSAAALIFRVANFKAIMARYGVYLWEKATTYNEFLPDDKKEAAKLLHAEGSKLSKQELNAARHVADAACRVMASAVVLRRHSWLRSSALTPDNKAKLEDLPFEGTTLFSDQTDEVLEKFRKSKYTARSLGLTANQTQTYKPRYFPRHYQSQQSFGKGFKQQQSSYQPFRQGYSASFRRNQPRSRGNRARSPRASTSKAKESQ